MSIQIIVQPHHQTELTQPLPEGHGPTTTLHIRALFLHTLFHPLSSHWTFFPFSSTEMEGRTMRPFLVESVRGMRLTLDVLFSGHAALGEVLMVLSYRRLS